MLGANIAVRRDSMVVRLEAPVISRTDFRIELRRDLVHPRRKAQRARLVLTHVSVAMNPNAILTLPSGKRARLIAYDPARPWEVYPHGTLFGLRRPRRGDSTEWEYFKNSSALVAAYSAADLEVLIEALRAWRSAKQPRIQP